MYESDRLLWALCVSVLSRNQKRNIVPPIKSYIFAFKRKHQMLLHHSLALFRKIHNVKLYLPLLAPFHNVKPHQSLPRSLSSPNNKFIVIRPLRNLYTTALHYRIVDISSNYCNSLNKMEEDNRFNIEEQPSKLRVYSTLFFKYIRPCVAELFGTTIFVFADLGGMNYISSTAFTHGLILFVLIAGTATVR